jgi:hypothetical protein
VVVVAGTVLMVDTELDAGSHAEDASIAPIVSDSICENDKATTCSDLISLPMRFSTATSRSIPTPTANTSATYCSCVAEPSTVRIESDVYPSVSTTTTARCPRKPDAPLSCCVRTRSIKYDSDTDVLPEHCCAPMVLITTDLSNEKSKSNPRSASPSRLSSDTLQQCEDKHAINQSINAPCQVLTNSKALCDTGRKLLHRAPTDAACARRAVERKDKIKRTRMQAR